MTIRTALLLVTAALACATAPAARAQAAQTLPAVRLNAGIHNIRAEVARTPEQRSVGLMHRRELGANDGMLFVFEQAGVQCFWMRNTLVPLSIAFLADDGRIVNIADMQPQSEQSQCSAQPVRHALEMNQGWFARRGVRAGAAISGLAAPR